jgi:hypothetical protein
MNFVTMEELQAALPHVLSAPKEAAPIEQLCLRPDYGARKFVNEITMTRECGMPGERWMKAPWLKLADGRPDPRIQVSILGSRVRDLVWRDRDGTPHPGDPIIADMDFSHANMPVGTLLSVGTATLRVSDKFNDACVKWKVRYGKDAKDWIVRPDNVEFRLRGVLCEIVADGVAKTGDLIRKL